MCYGANKILNVMAKGRGKYPQNLSCQSIKGYEFYSWSRVKLNTAQNSHHAVFSLSRSFGIPAYFFQLILRLDIIFI
jgi:hypothetical protein